MMRFFPYINTIVYVVAICVICSSVFVASSQDAFGTTEEEIQAKIEEAEKRIKDLEKKTAQYKDTIHEHQHEAASIQEQISGFQSQIVQLQDQIALTEEEIKALQLRIQKTGLEIRTSEADMAKQQTQMIESIRELYLLQRRSRVEILLQYDNLSDFFDEISNYQRIQEKFLVDLTLLRRTQAELEDKKVTLLLEEEELLALEEDLEAQNLLLVQQKQKQNDLLVQTRNDQRRYENLLSQSQAQEKELRAEIHKLEEELRALLTPASIPTGVFQYPTNGRITQHYGCLTSSFARRVYPACNGGAGGFHNGVDIGAPLGTPLYATDNGTVVGSSVSNYGYGTWIAIRHGNGVVSMYAHLSALIAPVGKVVKKGEIVGRMGSTGFSTGSHLHFVVYAPKTFRIVSSRRGGKTPIGATVDPFKYFPRIAVGGTMSV